MRRAQSTLRPIADDRALSDSGFTVADPVARDGDGPKSRLTSRSASSEGQRSPTCAVIQDPAGSPLLRNDVHGNAHSEVDAARM